MKKFIIDENLPRTVNFPGDYQFLHIVDFGRQMSDTEIWEYAVENQYIIVTKDTDFYERIVLYGPPPRVIWIRFGNIKRKKLENKLIDMWEKIVLEIDKHDLLEIYDNRIEGLKIQ